MVEKRIFVVGCPRSGTTLLQGMLAGNPEMHTFPETFFFTTAYPQNKIKRFLSWPSLNTWRYFPKLLSDMGRPDLIDDFRVKIFERDYHSAYLAVMDLLTIESRRKNWLEKTPRHLHCIKEIASRVPNAIFVHIVRDGWDVVASLVETTKKNPNEWAKFRKNNIVRWGGYSVSGAIARWNNDINLSKAAIGAANNYFVVYGDLVANPDAVMRALCREIGIEFDSRMIEPSIRYKKIVRGDEPWKAKNSREISVDEERWRNVFDASDIEKVRAGLVNIDFDEFRG